MRTLPPLRRRAAVLRGCRRWRLPREVAVAPRRRLRGARTTQGEPVFVDRGGHIPNHRALDSYNRAGLSCPALRGRGLLPPVEEVCRRNREVLLLGQLPDGNRHHIGDAMRHVYRSAGPRAGTTFGRPKPALGRQSISALSECLTRTKGPPFRSTGRTSPRWPKPRPVLGTGPEDGMQLVGEPDRGREMVRRATPSMPMTRMFYWTTM